MKKLLLFILPVVLLLAGTAAYAQATHKVKKQHRDYTIGFQSGRELLFNSSPAIHTHQSKVHTGVSSSLILRKPLTGHWAVSTGVNYYYPAQSKKLADKYVKPYTFALPVTVEYYFLPEHSRLRPYLGAGAQYNFLHKSDNTTISPFTDNTYRPSGTNNGTKYINILFTQGMTFEVNTKIQLTESIHFIPDNSNSCLCIDFGIGFRL